MATKDKTIKKKKSKLKKFLISAFIIILLISATGGIILSLYVGNIYKDWVSKRDQSMAMLEEYYNIIVIRGNEKRIRYFNPLNPFGDSPPTKIYDKNNILIGEYMPPAYEVVNVDDINPLLEKTLLLMEDQKFYSHKGINYFRSAYLAIQTVLTRKIVGGGSTLTQQLAKLLFTKSERTIERKLFEMFAAREIEAKYTKKEILAMYFNTVYLGDGNYGFEAAANYYFQKPLRQCRLLEFAIMVGMLPNPTYYSIVNNPDNSRKKVEQILSRLVKNKIIDEETKKAELELFDQKYTNISKQVKGAQWKMTVNRTPYANEYVRQELLNYFNKDELALSGLKIYTTINERYYRVADAVMKEKIRNLQASTSNRSYQGAMVSIDPKTGGILVMIGGDGYTLQNQFNRAVQAKRQIGSVIKPFIYLYAFEGGAQPFSTMLDTNYSYPQGPGKPAYSPRNFNRRYMGEITLETALTKSINTVAVKLLNDIGLAYFVDHAREFFGNDAYIPNALSIGLGTIEMSPLDLATAYGGLANNGTRYNNYIVDKVIDIDGNELSVTALADRTPKKISSTSQASYYFLNSTLQKVIAPGGTAYRSASTYGFQSPSYSAKTGTTSEHRDNWFVAYNDEIVTVAWIGSDRNDVLPNNVTGGATTALATFQYLDAITPVNKREFHWKVPEDVFIVEICQDSGLPRNHTCVNTTPLTVGGNIDLSTQCNIDHIRSGTRRNNNNDATNMADDEEEYYYPPLDENNNYTNENTNTENNNNIYTLPEEVIYDPTVGNIRS
ncbi:transglycosylase domain-containing protein [Brachyspira pilosicoli]|uniref:Penicillin-binding protein n=1 Tax=Brachyspira pilosicoli TaxID=52584 RepID=A0AAJ6GGD0_BRAPL|nr:transglycosylase domain-containing protein [Brachyspira pilosicoli]WIH89886.1 penicillin-binding protein [Brachyspira pilosicoli]WIH92181.1 penicillin-binding protein [Brachyspira pilosicoli]WIH94410.1 penicillin-binding protein [Brachyspira pilosicoli]